MNISLTLTFQSENNSPLFPVNVFWLGGCCATSNAQNKAATPGETNDFFENPGLGKIEQTTPSPQK